MEARQWAGDRTSKKKYRLPVSQWPNGTVAGSTKRLASWFYQLKTGHCLTGQYLNWTKSCPIPQCWWCRYRTQTGAGLPFDHGRGQVGAGCGG